MASIKSKSLTVKIFVNFEAFHLFDGKSACPHELCDDLGEEHLEVITLQCTVEDVKKVLAEALKDGVEAKDYSLRCRNSDDTLSDDDTLEDVFGSEVDVIELYASTTEYGKRKVISWGLKRIVLLVDNAECFTHVTLHGSRDLHTLKLKSADFLRTMDKLHVVDINSDSGTDLNQPNFQVRHYEIPVKEEGTVVIARNGNILIGKVVTDDEGAIIGVNGWTKNREGSEGDWIPIERDNRGNEILPRPFTIPRGDGVTKQYREAFNRGPRGSKAQKRFDNTLKVAKAIGELVGAGAAAGGVVFGGVEALANQAGAGQGASGVALE